MIACEQIPRAEEKETCKPRDLQNEKSEACHFQGKYTIEKDKQVIESYY